MSKPKSRCTLSVKQADCNGYRIDEAADRLRKTALGRSLRTQWRCRESNPGPKQTTASVYKLSS
jgi:hypothetical protein